MNGRFFISLLIICGAVCSVLGQAQEITKAEFYSVINNAVEKRGEFSRREKMTLTSYSKGVVNFIEEETDQFLIPDRQRYILIITENGKPDKTELIKVGGKFYQKENNGRWT